MEEIEPRLLVDIKIEAEGSQDSEAYVDRLVSTIIYSVSYTPDSVLRTFKVFLCIKLKT
jgi:hypothetical protein